jgi:hypothetical protein
MLELFIELTDQIFWEGYAQQLSRERPETFQQELREFMDSYGLQQEAIANSWPANHQNQANERHRFSIH